jgi:hypothetical protein
MHCTGCGMNIPFAGEVCPHCLRQKKSDQTGTVATGLGLLTRGFPWQSYRRLRRNAHRWLRAVDDRRGISQSVGNRTTEKPPNVRVDPRPMVKIASIRLCVATKAQGDAAARLRRLDDLKAVGLSSERQRHHQGTIIMSAL